MRSYAASTYYCSRIANRNYRVLTDAMVPSLHLDRSIEATHYRLQVTKILFAKSEGPLTAIGVEFSANGQLFNVFAKKEVVLAAGAVQTPQLLELSGRCSIVFCSPEDSRVLGIGNRTLLQSHGITTLVDLPGVGENLQVGGLQSITLQVVRLTRAWQEHLFSGVQFKLKQGIQTFGERCNNIAHSCHDNRYLTDLLRSDPAFAAEQRQI